MHRRWSLFFILFGPTFAPSLAAQTDKLTLDSARAAARAMHPAVRAAMAQARGARAEAASLGKLANPTLSINHESVAAEGIGSSELIGLIEQPLDIWGRRSASRGAASIRAAAADARVTVTAARAEEEATRAFAAAVAARWESTAAARTLAAFDRAVRIIRERQAAGDASGLDARRLQLERTRALAILVSAQQDRHSSLARLAGLIGRSPAALGSVMLLMDTLPDFTPAITLDSLERAVRLAPRELLALELETQAAAEQVVASDRARLPIPSLRLGGKWERSDATIDRRGFVAGVSIPIPIWNDGGAALDAANAEADRANADLDGARRALEVELLGVWDGLHEHADTFRELHLQIESNGTRILDALDVAFAEGELTVTEWLDALRTNQDAASLHAKLWLDLVGRLARLERLTGLDFLRGTP